VEHLVLALAGRVRELRLEDHRELHATPSG
jgi:hypothetical protein